MFGELAGFPFWIKEKVKLPNTKIISKIQLEKDSK